MMVKPFTARTAILAVTLCLCATPLGSINQSDQANLAVVLKRSAEYCRRLDKAALDFTCFEEVKETTHFYSPSTDVYLYDYQFIRKGAEIKERRNLVSVNGRKTNTEDSQLNTSAFQYKNALFGPVGLLSESWQAYHDYRLVGEDKIKGGAALIVEATPKAGLPVTHPYGRIWIKPEDGSVIKIAWDQRSVGNYQRMEEWAKENEAEAMITAYSEYGIEKNGLRFPTVNYTEQAFIRKNGRKSTSAEVSIVYRDYKFFTVETEIRY